VPLQREKKQDTAVFCDPEDQQTAVESQVLSHQDPRCSPGQSPVPPAAVRGRWDSRALRGEETPCL